MGLNLYLNHKTLNTYFINILLEYDPDQNGFTQKEFSNAICKMTTIFAKGVIKLSKADKKIFKDLDTDKDKNVSYQEITNYIAKEYKLDFYTLMSMKMSDVCDAIDNADKEKE